MLQPHSHDTNNPLARTTKDGQTYTVNGPLPDGTEWHLDYRAIYEASQQSNAPNMASFSRFQPTIDPNGNYTSAFDRKILGTLLYGLSPRKPKTKAEALADGVSTKVFQVERPDKPNLTLRVQYPTDTSRMSDRTAVYMYAHGGGGVTGGLERPSEGCKSGDNITSRIVSALGIPTVSVDYRLGPEDRWPAGQEDVNDAGKWALGQLSKEIGCGDVSGLVWGGTSSGGGMALLAAMKLAKLTAGDGMTSSGGGLALEAAMGPAKRKAEEGTTSSSAMDLEKRTAGEGTTSSGDGSALGAALDVAKRTVGETRTSSEDGQALGAATDLAKRPAGEGTTSSGDGLALRAGMDRAKRTAGEGTTSDSKLLGTVVTVPVCSAKEDQYDERWDKLRNPLMNPELMSWCHRHVARTPADLEAMSVLSASDEDLAALGKNTTFFLSPLDGLSIAAQELAERIKGLDGANEVEVQWYEGMPHFAQGFDRSFPEMQKKHVELVKRVGEYAGKPQEVIDAITVESLYPPESVA